MREYGVVPVFEIVVTGGAVIACHCRAVERHFHATLNSPHAFNLQVPQ